MMNEFSYVKSKKKPEGTEYIDLKNLDNLVPVELKSKINLLFNKDIPKQPSNADELLLSKLSKLNESAIQQSLHSSFNSAAKAIKCLNKNFELEFVQNDNGDSSAGRLTAIQRMALFRRKKAEGSRKGFPDISMYISNGVKRDTVFCEVKKIAAPSGIHLTQEQLDWFIKLNKMGFDAYITNNPVFFRNVLLFKIENFFKNN